MWNPDEDGITHINVYSKGKTELGRFLSNFTYFPIVTEDGPFDSIEGYWYWLSCHDNSLRHMYGWQAKQFGRQRRGKDWVEDTEFKKKIKLAIIRKLLDSEVMFKLMEKNKLPFTHYYVYGSSVVDVPQAKWITDFLDELCKTKTGETE